MMKRNIFFLMSVAVALSTQAQDTYDAANFANTDLNGTARYVGMGGALGALGGDLSTMSSNPAGTAMFRRAELAVSASGLFTGESGQMGHDKGRASLDQLGVVFALNTEGASSVKRINFGVNYSKSRNHFGNMAVNVGNLANTFSQTFQIADLASESSYRDAVAYYNGENYSNWGMLGFLSTKGGIITIDHYDNLKDENENDLYDTDGNKIQYPVYNGVNAQRALYLRHTWGSTTSTDFNLSMDISDQFFFGLSLGVYDLNYSRDAWYQEVGTNGNYYDFTNWYDTDGHGFDVKLGAIIRPFPSSPFRIGLTIHTPTWYRLEDTNGSILYYNDNFVDQRASDPYEYDYRTPWKFGLSLGHTVGNYFAIGAEYEYTDLGTAHYSDVSGEMSEREYFRTVNDRTKNMLKGQHTLKLGMEVKPADFFSIRAGYNYVSSPYEKDDYRTIEYYQPFTETDFCNWQAINRFTFGVGFRYKGGYFDLAYQYQSQKGDFYAFDNDVEFRPTEVENNRSQIMGTLGFRF